MKGFNKLVLCPAAMNEALEKYLNNYVLVTGHVVKVDNVELTKTGEFEVKFTDKTESK